MLSKGCLYLLILLCVFWAGIFYAVNLIIGALPV